MLKYKSGKRHGKNQMVITANANTCSITESVEKHDVCLQYKLMKWNTSDGSIDKHKHKARWISKKWNSGYAYEDGRSI